MNSRISRRTKSWSGEQKPKCSNHSDYNFHKTYGKIKDYTNIILNDREGKFAGMIHCERSHNELVRKASKYLRHAGSKTHKQLEFIIKSI